MLLADVGCSSSENNLTSCCATEIRNNFHCQSGVYAGVRCMHIILQCIWTACRESDDILQVINA